MAESRNRRERVEHAARQLRESGVDGATFGRRILAVLPHLPVEADGDVWRAAREIQEMDLTNEDLVHLLLAIGLRGEAEQRDE